MDAPSRVALGIVDVTRAYCGVHALNGVSFRVPGCGVTGLIGPNGARKTTLFNCICGVAPPDSGEILFNGENIAGLQPDRIFRLGLMRSLQIARGLPARSVRDNLTPRLRSPLDDRWGSQQRRHIVGMPPQRTVLSETLQAARFEPAISAHALKAAKALKAAVR